MPTHSSPGIVFQKMGIRSITTIGFLLMALYVCFAGCMTSDYGSDISKPNIIFILADDLSFRDLSCYGQQQYKTPNLDLLAQTGIRFSQAYAAAPECAPSRGCLMTGLHTGHGPIRANQSARGQDNLRDEDITIAEVLREAGYKCGFTGKWGIGLPGTEGVPYKQGFDLAFGFYDQSRAHTYFPHYLWQNDRRIDYPGNIGFDMPKRYSMNVKNPPDEVLNQYDKEGKLFISEIPDMSKAVFSQSAIEEAAMGFVKENSKNPFFLYFATQLPHGPVIIDKMGEMADRDDIPQMSREWAAMVMRLDQFTGRLIDLLKELEVYENTIIFFASDNGYSMCGYMGRGNAPDWPDDPWLRNKGPFTGGKFSVLEGGCRIPFFVHWPSKIDPGVVSEPVWLPDFFPTAASLAGVKNVPETDGIDLGPLIFGKKHEYKGHEYLYFSKYREQAVRMGDWKAYRKSPEDSVKLYLVEEDTYGERDLSAIYPDLVKRAGQIMDTEYTPHEWYWNPDETREDFDKKRQKAKETDNILTVTRPNGMK
jgi:arylsulfatase A-like enzyme